MNRPTFMPGGPDVCPGKAGVLENLLPSPEHGAVVVGNYQATRRSYERILDRDIGGFPTTWRVLRQILACLSPREVFLTNAFIGLPDLAGDTVPFPTTPAFTRRCGELLITEIELLCPRLVVCLGVPAAKMLARITVGLDRWRPWPGYAALDRQGVAVVHGCTIAGVKFAAVAVRHPSAVLSREQRQRDAGLIAGAAIGPQAAV